VTINLVLKRELGAVTPYKLFVGPRPNVVDQYIKAGYIANLCAIDLSKAFDKINDHALYTKLMKRHVPNKLLDILENWLCGSHACVKWDNLWSYNVHD